MEDHLPRVEILTRFAKSNINEALKLQRPLPDGSLKIVARGEKQDGLNLDAA